MENHKKPGNVGVAVVGLGRGMDHVKAAMETEGAQLLAVCDINEGKVADVAEQYGVTAYTDYKELLRRSDIDLISICTPSGLHCDMAVEAANAGKHVLSEKPLDISLEKIDRAVSAFEKKDLLLGCIFQNRLYAATAKMKETIDNGRLGELILATAHIKWYRTQEYYEQNGGWRGTWALDGGGSLINQSIHTIDLMQWMMGPVKSVIGQTRTWSHDIETEDMGVALVKFENGAIGTIVGSTAAYPGFGTSLEINGVNGGIHMRDNHISSWKIKGENMDAEEQEILSMHGPDAGGEKVNTTLVQMQDMVSAVKGNRAPVVSGKEGRKAVEIILAIYQSAQTEKEVFLPL